MFKKRTSSVSSQFLLSRGISRTHSLNLTTNLSGFIQTLCGVAGVVVVFVKIPLLAIYSYALMILSAVAINVTSALAVDLYPTNLR